MWPLDTIGWKAISRTYDPWLLGFHRIVISHFTSSQVESLRRGEWRRLDFAKGPKGLFGSLAEQCWTFGNRFRTSKPQFVCFFRSITFFFRLFRWSFFAFCSQWHFFLKSGTVPPNRWFPCRYWANPVHVLRDLQLVWLYRFQDILSRSWLYTAIVVNNITAITQQYPPKR